MDLDLNKWSTKKSNQSLFVLWYNCTSWVIVIGNLFWKSMQVYAGMLTCISPPLSSPLLSRLFCAGSVEAILQNLNADDSAFAKKQAEVGLLRWITNTIIGTISSAETPGICVNRLDSPTQEHKDCGNRVDMLVLICISCKK